MATTARVPADTPADRLTQLEASFRDLKAILDDPLQLIDRLRELELQRRSAK